MPRQIVTRETFDTKYEERERQTRNHVTPSHCLALSIARGVVSGPNLMGCLLHP